MEEVKSQLTVRHNNKNLTVDAFLNNNGFNKEDKVLKLMFDVTKIMVDEIDVILDSDSATLTIGAEYFYLHGLKVYWANVVKLRPKIPSGLIFACYKFDSCTCGEV